MYYTRTIEPTIKKINETFPVLIITGPRQVGKTTLLTSSLIRIAKLSRWIIPQSGHLPKPNPNYSFSVMLLPF